MLKGDNTLMPLQVDNSWKKNAFTRKVCNNKKNLDQSPGRNIECADPPMTWNNFEKDVSKNI